LSLETCPSQATGLAARQVPARPVSGWLGVIPSDYAYPVNIEHYHHLVKIVLNPRRYFLRGNLEAENSSYVAHYNHKRYHESLYNLTTSDIDFIRAKDVLKAGDEIQ